MIAVGSSDSERVGFHGFRFGSRLIKGDEDPGNKKKKFKRTPRRNTALLRAY